MKDDHIVNLSIKNKEVGQNGAVRIVMNSLYFQASGADGLLKCTYIGKEFNCSANATVRVLKG